MRNQVGAIVLQLIVLGAFAVLNISSPHAALACGCCACDFGGGTVLCGDGDVDCGGCIIMGGVPAPTCDVCDSGDCTDETLCAGDPNECSTDVTGGCCVPPSDPDFPGGCFILTAAGCTDVQGIYRGDNTDCTGPCVVATAAPAPAMSHSGVAATAILLFAIGAVGLARRRAQRQKAH